jgi:glycosyltransferase involved in cell wall biosynthesis
MKIIQVTPYFYPHLGGVESHVYTISKELVDRGHNVSVFTSKVPIHAKDEEYLDGIRVNRIKPIFNLFTTPVMPKLKNKLIAQQADVVHAHVPPPFSEYYAASACKYNKLPFALTYHCDLEIPNLLSRPVVAFYRRTFGAYAIRNSDRIIVHTESYAATSRSVWKYEPTIIPSAIDIDRFQPKDLSSKIRKKHKLGNSKIVLYLGRLKFHKGLEYLIESAKFTDSDIKYLIVGEGDYENQLREIVDNLGVQERVIFTGRVPNSEIPKYYNACDVFILPSVERLEAFGLVVIEAMASGKPVIISNIPGVRENITDGEEGLLIEPTNPEDIAEKINHLMADKKFRERMGAKGRKKVENNYTLKRVVDQLEEVYQELSE